MLPGLTPPDPESVLLCQIPGLEAPVLRRLVERWETPSAILRAPSSELRTLGLAPALVARLVAAPRQRAGTEAGMRSLVRMGIVPLPLLHPAYPERLQSLAAPPLLLFVQGAWPPPSPVVAVQPGGELDEALREELVGLLSALADRDITIAAASDDLALLPPQRSTAMLPYGLLLAHSRVPDALRAAATNCRSTLISVAAVNAPTTAPTEAIAREVLLALADGLLVAGGPSAGTIRGRPDLHVWELQRGSTRAGLRTRHAIPGGEPGARLIMHSLGIRPAGDALVQQERLW